ncbi:NAR1 [Candida oxycetoniae]|uniref:Cytosolic Fe-S cluster assembly factor NAR1 n=1 Tax=Candida oxycetoniae TaxID=497107 RepID=A0AAI9X0J4_9ASCO|nr:NAR1 [Candida oxycetoniae]KAI3407150.2 NAR1 [Candida oxycetoniae]
MSAILSADDLNDFISPGVACIKPVDEIQKPRKDAAEPGEVEIQMDDQGNPLEISRIDEKQTSTLAPAQISLADCLACSGCITSAEEVLVAQHSHQELIKALQSKEAKDTIFVASISQQSRASLATAYDLSIEDIDRMLVNLFVNQMGFKYVVGTSLGRKLSLITESKSLIQRKQREKNFANPILSSVCPGWVLYAEKTHPYVLPMMSTVKSSQQITGCLLKNLTAYSCNVPKQRVYHLSLMPCFDKKLESARPELLSGDSVPDVDCVLTAKELVTLLEESQNQYQLTPKIKPLIMNQPIEDVYNAVAPPNWPFVQYSWSNDPGSSSGGYAYTYLRIYQDELISKGYNPQDFSMKIVQGKNSDIWEMRLCYQGETLASSCIVNGFRNIQNLVRKIKPGNARGVASKVNPLAGRRRARVKEKTDASKVSTTEEIADASKVDYVEIMACPQGCINGGGQIQAAPNVNEKDWINEVLMKYNTVPMFDLSLQPEDIVKFIEWSTDFERQFSISNERLMKTHFNKVEKPTDPTAILVGSKW